MAIINEEEDKNVNQTGQGLNTSGQAGVVGAGGAPAGATQSTAGGGQAGSGWTNLQTYLDVNKGQGGQLADQVGTDVNNKVEDFKKTDVSGAINEIGQAAGTTEADEIKKDVAANAGKAKTFLNQGFGAKQVTDYTAPINATAASVKDNLNQLNDQNYQKGALQKLNNKQGNYTGGFGALDSFILNGDEQGREKLSGIQKSGNDAVGSTMSGITDQLTKARGDANSLFEANKLAVKGAAKGQYTGLMDQAALRAKEKSGQSKTAASGTISQKRAEAVQSDAELDTPDIAGDGFVKGADYAASDVLTDADITALNSLAGLDPSLGISPVARTQGTGYSADVAGYDKLIGEKKAGLEAKREAARKAAAEEAARKAAAEAAARQAQIDRDAAAQQERIAEAARIKAKSDAAKVGAATAGGYSNPENVKVDDSFWKPANPPPAPAGTPSTSNGQGSGIVGAADGFDINNPATWWG